LHIPASTDYMRYGADNHDPWTIYWVHYSGKNLAIFNTSLNIKSENGPIRINFNAKAIDIWETMYSTLEQGYGRDNLCHANLCLYHFLATFFYPEKPIKSSPESDFVTKTTRYMRANIEKRLTLEDFAKLH